MGKFYKFTGHCLGLLCASAFAVQALAANNLNLPVDRHGYFILSEDSFRTPTTAKIRAAITAANPHVEKLPGGGLSQSVGGNIELTANKQTSPISAKVKAGVPAFKNGAKTLVKGGLAGIVITEGLQALFDGIDWMMEDGVVVNRTPKDITDLPPGSYTHPGSTVRQEFLQPQCPNGTCFVTDTVVIGLFTYNYYCYSSHNGNPFIGYNGQCVYLPGANPADGFSSAPVPDSAIDDAVDQYYEPEPEDWQLLARHIDPSDPDVYAEIASIPSILTPPTTKTIYDANGNPVEVQETNIWYDFDITDNNTKQPAIDITERKETKTYDEYGQLTGTETTTSSNKASSSSSSSASADFDIPTDCEFMPTVCRFLAWFQEPDPELSNEPDLQSLRHDLEPERNFEVGSSTAGCPEPITISLAMFPSVEVSLQPLCDFVDLLRPLLLAFASYFATLIVLRAF